MLWERQTGSRFVLDAVAANPWSKVQDRTVAIFPIAMLDWLNALFKPLRDNLSQLLTVELFRLGRQSFTLGLIARFIVAALIVLIVSRLISEGIKRWVLRPFGLPRGSREAIATIINYLLIVLGTIVILQAFGIEPTSLTVITGALGLAFALGFQNLANHFLSGLNILIEQPIKVGDYIEIDDLVGTVEKISTRSTVIQTLTGVFAIVPNNRFVENDVLNWSYEDSICGLLIPVGVAYGSDLVLVTEALFAAARKESRVLAQPAPKVLFNGFGDSSLDFELFIWIDNPPAQKFIISAVNFLIETEFRCRGIEIPFPQRDLHIRTPEALNAVLRKPREEGLGVRLPAEDDKVSLEDVRIVENKRPRPKSLNQWTLRDLLRQVSYFERCSDRELRLLIEYGYRQLFQAGQLVCRENDPGDSFYIILSGSVEVFAEQGGQHIAIANRHAGEFFGEMSLLLGMPRSASIRTLEDTILFVVDRSNLQNLLTTHRNLADRISEELAARQESLRSLGLLSDGSRSAENPLEWIRDRIQLLFGI